MQEADAAAGRAAAPGSGAAPGRGGAAGAGGAAGSGAAPGRGGAAGAGGVPGAGARTGEGCAGRAVIITGGTRGIGAGLARAFLRAGARVLVCGRTEPAAGPGRDGQPSVAGLPAADGRAAAFAAADVRDPEQVHRLVSMGADLFGRVDVVISNAGGAPPVAAATAAPRLHARIVELNLIAPLHVAQAANEVMQQQPGGGSIILIGSVGGTRPSPGSAAYGAAKAGLHHLAASLAVEWAPLVRVNCVVPGMVATEAARAHYGDDDTVAAVARTVPLRRMGTPDDVAAACLFLASPQAAYVSGASLVVHGGGERPAFLAAAPSPLAAPS